MEIIDGNCVVADDASGIAIEALITSMRENNISKSVVFPKDGWAAVYNSQGNDFIERAMNRHPGRLIGFASANPWYGDASAKELRRRLRNGFRGVYFHSIVQGFTIDDELVFPLLECCAEFGAPVYFHTGTPSGALPFSVMMLAKRFPDISFIMGHMGLYDYLGDACAAADACENIYLDMSYGLSLFYRTVAHRFPERTLFGSGAPRYGQRTELAKLYASVPDPAIQKNALSQNILKLIGDQPV